MNALARSAAVALVALGSACASAPETPPAYRPTENALEAVAVLRLHVDDDTYRFDPAIDVTGKNVYRASFERLERLEDVHADKYKSGYLMDVLWFSKGRALERIGEYGLAARHYERVSELDSPLAGPAREGLRVNRALQAIQAEPPPAAETSPELALVSFDTRRAALEALRSELAGSHYAAVAAEELERADQQRARWLATRAGLDPRLDALALQAHQDLVSRHAESRLRRRHLLALGDLYAGLARRYVDRHPAVSLSFEPAVFDELAFGATRLYELVSREDGAIEKIEAARKLEAFLAFQLQVYAEKLPH